MRDCPLRGELSRVTGGLSAAGVVDQSAELELHRVDWRGIHDARRNVERVDEFGRPQDAHPGAEFVFRLLGDEPSFDLRGLYAPFASGNYKLGPEVETSARFASGVRTT